MYMITETSFLQINGDIKTRRVKEEAEMT